MDTSGLGGNPDTIRRKRVEIAVGITVGVTAKVTVGVTEGVTVGVTVGGTVLEHNVTADKNGSRTYSTIVRSDDGFIEDVVGLDIYIVPVGGRVTYEKRRHKPLSF